MSAHMLIQRNIIEYTHTTHNTHTDICSTLKIVRKFIGQRAEKKKQMKTGLLQSH